MILVEQILAAIPEVRQIEKAASISATSTIFDADVTKLQKEVEEYKQPSK